MTEDLVEFSSFFHDEIRAEAHAIEAMREEVFVMKMGDILEEYGEIESLVQSQYNRRGVKVDGYSYDDEFKDFVLIVSHYLDEDDTDKAKVSNKETVDAFKRVMKFFLNSMEGGHSKIDVANEAYELAKLIYDCREDIRNVKLVLITDGIIKKAPAEVEQLGNVEIIKIAWDIERTAHFHRTGEREQITVDFSKYCNGPLPCIVKEEKNSRYTTYLGFIPGTALADLYAVWGIKMLDMNVRVFLSARGNVNKGIRKTIKDEPGMFCAYNNGITVFARSVETVPLENSTGLLMAEDFQIINGGQTTASLYHTRKKDRADIDGIVLQMKLMVINDENDITSAVPRISEYSNTQNKVQMADLKANESPHPEIQAISSSILAPDPTGGSHQTYWFYERSRGSYEEYRNMTAATQARKREFDTLRPKKQKFDKIKFGKVWNSFLRLPHVVSLGAQKNFGRFNDWLREQKEEDWNSFFRKTVALLILWNEVEKMVRRQKFQGYHHNIVAYSLAWLFHLTGSRVDLEKIWQKQIIGDPVVKTLEQITAVVNAHIRDTDQNVTEYCKKETCWDKLKNIDFTLPENIKEEYSSGKRPDAPDSTIPSETEAVEFCRSKGSTAWYDLAKWLKQMDFLAPKARSQSFNMGRCLQRKKEPSGVLSKACGKIWKDAEIRGWKFDQEQE
ncbi:AIPR family protein [Thermodesulfobacteriota bacterium]